jgi:hypothetical protein
VGDVRDLGSPGVEASTFADPIRLDEFNVHSATAVHIWDNNWWGLRGNSPHRVLARVGGVMLRLWQAVEPVESPDRGDRSLSEARPRTSTVDSTADVPVGDRLSPAADIDVIVQNALPNRNGHDHTGPEVVGVVEHLDSARVMPPFSVPPGQVARMGEAAVDVVRERGLLGEFTVQFALSGNSFCLVGIDNGWSPNTQLLVDGGSAAAVACLAKDGYTVASGRDLGSAYATAMTAAGTPLPLRGRAFLAVTGRDRRQLALLARALVDLGFDLVADEDTTLLLRRHGVPVTPVAEEDVADLIWHGNVHLIVDIGRPGRPLTVSEQTPVLLSIRGLLVAIQAIQAQNDFLRAQHKKVERARFDCP